MMRNSKVKMMGAALVLSAGALCYLPSCTKHKTPVPVEPCDPAKVYYQRDVFPIVNSNCAKSGCHDAVTREEGLDLSTYSGVSSIVIKGKPSSSKLIEVLTEAGEDRMPPEPASPLTSEQRAVLTRWIAEGAYNSSCTSDTASCDAGSPTYSKDIQPVVLTNCLGCHSGNSAGGGIDLSAYQGVRAVALSGKLYLSVSQSGGAAPMPPSGKLSACDIKKIKVWAEGGANQQ